MVKRCEDGLTGCSGELGSCGELGGTGGAGLSGAGLKDRAVLNKVPSGVFNGTSSAGRPV